MASYVGSRETESDELGMKTRNHTTLMRRRNLRVVDGDGQVHHSNCESTDNSASDEHADVDGSGLDDSSDESNDSSDGDGLPTTELVGTPSCKEHAKDGPSAKRANQGALEAGSEGGEVERKLFLGDNGRDDTRVDTVPVEGKLLFRSWLWDRCIGRVHYSQQRADLKRARVSTLLIDSQIDRKQRLENIQRRKGHSPKCTN